jgi:hypothetical protein
VARDGSATLRGAPLAGKVVIVDVPLDGPDSTTNVAVASSNTQVKPGPPSGRTTPSTGVWTGGDTAAEAGAIVGGGASDECFEHATAATTITSARLL